MPRIAFHKMLVRPVFVVVEDDGKHGPELHANEVAVSAAEWAAGWHFDVEASERQTERNLWGNEPPPGALELPASNGHVHDPHQVDTPG